MSRVRRVCERRESFVVASENETRFDAQGRDEGSRGGEERVERDFER